MAASRDEQVLDIIFNPDKELVLPDEGSEPLNPYPQPSQEVLAQLKSLEREAVSFAEKGKVDDAIQSFTKCIELWPTYASAYNNRAQARRMNGDKEGSLKDLDLAITFGVGDAKTLKQAYSQRGFLKRHLGDEAGANVDFAEGAKYGNELAKAAVKNNPYAKMCNAMVKEAMAKLQ
ncbi:Tetratricopeptide repeat protein 36 [Dinochytrium kinnereticum]|nr:Tetratricopeptide repeat protein 36 [Dinochytrium kinnereticum]